MSNLAPYLMLDREIAPQDFSKKKSRIAGKFTSRIPLYIEIPGFQLSVIWRGASEIVTRFVFNRSQSTSGLLDISKIKPLNPNFVVCISWYKNEVTYRYKLWKDVGEILYVPMYEGQPITADTWALEFWNTNSSPLICPDLLIRTTNYHRPTDKCDDSALVINENFSECGDPLFHIVDDAWNPSEGDYYIFQDYCTRIIQRGNIVTITYPDNLLHCADDDTWHYVWTDTVDGNIVIYIDQSAAPVGPLGYFPMVDQQDETKVIKVNLQLIEGTYHIQFDGEVAFPGPYNVVLLNHVDSQYYSLILGELDDEYVITVGQTPVIP